MFGKLTTAARLEMAIKKVVPSAHSVRIGKLNDRSTWSVQGVPEESATTVHEIVARLDLSEEAARRDTLEYYLDQDDMLLTQFLRMLVAELAPNRPWESVKRSMKERLQSL